MEGKQRSMTQAAFSREECGEREGAETGGCGRGEVKGREEWERGESLGVGREWRSAGMTLRGAALREGGRVESQSQKERASYRESVRGGRATHRQPAYRAP